MAIVIYIYIKMAAWWTPKIKSVIQFWASCRIKNYLCMCIFVVPRHWLYNDDAKKYVKFVYFTWICIIYCTHKKKNIISKKVWKASSLLLHIFLLFNSLTQKLRSISAISLVWIRWVVKEVGSYESLSVLFFLVEHFVTHLIKYDCLQNIAC